MAAVNPREAHMVVIESELIILRAMCQGALDRRVWQDGVELLAEYPFQDNLHQVVFDTLLEMKTDDPRIIQGLLPARLTIKGFPDLDLSTFFAPHNLKAPVLLAMMHSVASLARRRVQHDIAPMAGSTRS
ncbi:MAG: hypothetical protein HY046_09760 [Acidobacteria bacterium]|nr:hypothetical protein [Acidobacteriota bacterium]